VPIGSGKSITLAALEIMHGNAAIGNLIREGKIFQNLSIIHTAYNGWDAVDGHPPDEPARRWADHTTRIVSLRGGKKYFRVKVATGRAGRVVVSDS